MCVCIKQTQPPCYGLYDNCVFEIYALIYHTFINNIKQYVLIVFQNFVFLLKTSLTEINVPII